MVAACWATPSAAAKAARATSAAAFSKVASKAARSPSRSPDKIVKQKSQAGPPLRKPACPMTNTPTRNVISNTAAGPYFPSMRRSINRLAQARNAQISTANKSHSPSLSAM